MSRYFVWPIATCFCVATFSTTYADDIATSNICEQVAQRVSLESGVPLSVLRAISLNETGRKKDGKFRPWPWTVNMEGVGKWFDEQSSAKSYVDKHFSRGARSFDVGCFQINYRWHGQAFDSIEDMFDPLLNARYAASFLSELFEEFGDWSKAAGAYHSRTPKYAIKYAARFDRIRGRLDEPPLISIEPAVDSRPETPTRTNNFPLLQRGIAQAGMASLVPLSGQPQTRLIDMRSSRPLREGG